MSSESVESDGERTERDDRSADSTPDPDDEIEDLRAQVELLAEENRRLRGEYVRARQATYRRTALGLLAVGALAALAGVALPDARTVLFALAGTGLFGGVLSYYLTPERFVAAGTGERIYAALAATGRELVAELGLRDERIYAPARAPDERFAGVRLFVPQRGDYVVPDPEALDSLFVVTESGPDRGVAVPPTGGALYREFETVMTDEVADDPTALADQLADGLVEGFELAESAAAEADPAGGRATVEISGGVYGAANRFDHPIASFLAVGLAANLGVAVETSVTGGKGGEGEEGGDGGSSGDCLVTCRWDAEQVEEREG